MNVARETHSKVKLPSRRGLSRDESAGYIGVGSSKFDTMVSDGRMPKPKRIDGRRVWDRQAIDRAFGELPGGDQTKINEWDN